MSAPATTVRVDELRAVDLLAALPDDRLRWIVERVRERRLEPGDTLWREGDPPGPFFLLLEGEVEDTATLSGVPTPVNRHVGPTYMGAMPLLNETRWPTTATALAPARVAVLGAEDFLALVEAEPGLATTLMRIMGPLGRHFEGLVRQQEKLAALGQLSAGLAHELNNPAAAARRAAHDLGAAVTQLGAGVGALADLSPDGAREVARLAAELGDGSSEPLDTLEGSEREDELADRLDELGVEDPWSLTSPLVAAGADPAAVDRIAAATGAEHLGPALTWVAANLSARALIGELEESTRRISELVGAVKGHSHMDQGGGPQEVDVHAGLESTLTLLGHKLRNGTVRVERDFDRSLPPVRVHGAELNQVWVNLIDNAVFALDGHGTLRLSTAREGSCLAVEIADDGPGIPPDALSRVFDPFFTTKDVGEGTGLGLDTVQRLVARNGGSVTLDSKPGDTRFRVRLPLAGGGSAA